MFLYTLGTVHNVIHSNVEKEEAWPKEKAYSPAKCTPPEQWWSLGSNVANSEKKTYLGKESRIYLHFEALYTVEYKTWCMYDIKCKMQIVQVM